MEDDTRVRVLFENIEKLQRVYGKYEDSDEWEEAEFIKYDKDMEYGKYICLTTSHDGKIVECFDEIKTDLHSTEKVDYDNLRF